MDIKDFKSGVYKPGYKYRYFLPEKINHSFVWKDEGLNTLLEEASLCIGELNAFSRFVPNIDIFIKMHVMKEAVISSRIEGTQTNLTEAFTGLRTLEPEKRDDWQEVNNYVNAMNYALREIETLPLSNRLIRDTHRILLSSGRGEYKQPGEFRTSQNWIGGATLADAAFIPPAPNELSELLSDFELFLNNFTIQIPHLVRIAIAHYQFETIHPFLDGNGRIGRLLITLYFVSNHLLEAPVLYISDFFDRNRLSYYDNLTRVRTHNALGQWIKFFLTGVIQTTHKASNTLQQIMDLRTNIETEHILMMGRRSKQGMVFLDLLFSHPVVAVKDVQSLMNLSPKTANALVDIFVKHGILTETTGYRRNRVFVFDAYLRLFEG